jgi:hypothetical protein
MYREIRKGVTRLTGGKLGTQTTALDVWPIGSIHLRYDNTNPGTLFGGTWTQMARGKMLMGQDDTDVDFDTLGETGGLKSKALTLGQIPPHPHSSGTLSANDAGSHTHPPGSYGYTRKAGAGSQAGASSGNTTAASDGQVTGTSGSGGLHGHAILGDTGDGSSMGLGNAAVDRMPPFIVVYVWRRTA